jgi:hypothetical protein
MRSHVHEEDGHLVCACGATEEDDTFYPCDTHGHLIEPFFHPEWKNLVLCTCCARIINIKTQRVVRRCWPALFGEVGPSPYPQHPERRSSS